MSRTEGFDGKRGRFERSCECCREGSERNSDLLHKLIPSLAQGMCISLDAFVVALNSYRGVGNACEGAPEFEVDGLAAILPGTYRAKGHAPVVCRHALCRQRRVLPLTNG